VNGADIYYEERGTGPAVLFIHGMCGNANVWDDQVTRLGDDVHCVAYDRRGHTRSSLGEIERRTVQLHGDDTAALIRALDLAPCLLVGSSGGARVGVDVVLRYPDLLSGAVLSEPPLFELDPAAATVFQAELGPILQRALEAGGPRSAVDAFFENVCPGLWRSINDQRREIYRANAGELLADLQMPPYQVGAEDLERVRVPCLIVRGDRSHPSLMCTAGLLAKGIAGAELIELADSGHVTYAEQPGAFASAVHSFAARHVDAVTG
jgi:3-oxoadipate enol-lactonase